MANRIGWCTTTWSPVVGCSRVGDGCENCWAIKQARRMHTTVEHYKAVTTRKERGIDWTGEIGVAPQHIWDKPFEWKKPQRIFVCSMGDLFHENVSNHFIDKVFNVMLRRGRHEYMLLTKRPDRMRDYFDYRTMTARWTVPPQNIHAGISVWDQASADKMIPPLLQTPAAKRFVSLEPMLGPVDLRDALDGYPEAQGGGHFDEEPDWVQTHPEPDQIIVGAETGQGARPMDLDCARSIRDQCADAGVAFWFKKDSQGRHTLDGQIHEGLPE